MANTFSVPLRAIGSYRGPQLNCFAPGKKVEQITIIHSSPSSPHSRLLLHKDQALVNVWKALPRKNTTISKFIIHETTKKCET